MNTRRLYIFLLLTLTGILTVRASAKTPITNLSLFSVSPAEISVNSELQKQPDKRDEKKQKDKKGDTQKPEIKEVPKSKRQIKPAAVKSKTKTPVKRVKPAIRKPVRPRKKPGV